MNGETHWRTVADDREKYALYLCSREWNSKREAVKSRSQGICERCRHQPMDAVHHLTYIRKYDERLEDLQAICDPCHQFIHGKSDSDPKREAPIIVNGDVIRRVYLAGKIRRHDPYRSAIIRRHRSATIDAYGDHVSQWPILDDHIDLEDRTYKLGYTGPFTMSCDHGCFHAAKHAYGEGCCAPIDNTKLAVMDLCLNAIVATDLVFAWIDTEDCYGTINEIGFAHAHGKPILIAGPTLYKELWFTYNQATRCLFGIAAVDEAFQSMVVRGAGQPFGGYVATSLNGQLLNWCPPDASEDG